MSGAITITGAGTDDAVELLDKRNGIFKNTYVHYLLTAQVI